MFKRCRTCLYPNTKPDLYFDGTGECSACINFKNRPNIDWEARKQALIQLLDRHDGKCIVPSSGGKDSHYQAKTLLDLGADVTIITATTCHLTPIGRKNIDNLSRHAKTVEVSPSKQVRAKLNRLGLELVGDISWPEHAAIFSTPFNMACALNIPLIFYGECPQQEYGGPQGSEKAIQMSRRWVSEYGGFLGLRPADFVGVEGITETDMQDYMPPTEDKIIKAGIEAHFLGQYLPWNSWENADIAMDAGMYVRLPHRSCYWGFENLDNAQTGLHDHAAYRKYGYGRFVAQVSVDMRSGIVDRKRALELVRICDGLFPEEYAGVPICEVLDRIGMTREQLMQCLDSFTNWELFDRVENDRPILKEFA